MTTCARSAAGSCPTPEAERCERDHPHPEFLPPPPDHDHDPGRRHHRPLDDADRARAAPPVARILPAPGYLCGGVRLTPPADLLPRLVEIIRGWERAEG